VTVVLSILDRYLIRAITPPLFLGLALTTFLLVLPLILREAEVLVAKGVDWSVIVDVLLTLLPQALSVTIPMALLLGVLMGLAPLSADRECVALQACGVSLTRLLRPVLLVAGVAAAATAHQVIVALPEANDTFRQITFGLVATRVEEKVKPRVFFEDFPHHLIYVRDLPPGGGWRDVLVTDTSDPDKTTVYFAREGRLSVDRVGRRVQLQLVDGVGHTTTDSRPDAYEGTSFERLLINLDPETVFPARTPPKGPPEKSLAELRATIDEELAQGRPAVPERLLFQYKLALPVACPIMAVIALALGASARRDGRFASFVLGVAVILAYYVLLYGARALAMGGRLHPELAPWLPNVVLGMASVALIIWRDRLADLRAASLWRPLIVSRVRGLRSPLAARARSRRRTNGLPVADSAPAAGRDGPRRLTLPCPRILDRYVTREYLRVFALGVAGLLGIFYVSTFLDLADKLFRGAATTTTLLAYFFFQTPQFVYFVTPMAVLVATLVTVGAMARSHELLVMRACGVSLYRTTLPLVLLAAAAGGALYLMEERVLAAANRRADALNRAIRGWPPRSTAIGRRWIVGRHGDLYHFDFFEPSVTQFARLRLYHLDTEAWRLRALTYAEHADTATVGADGSSTWVTRRGWRREMAGTPGGRDQTLRYEAFDERPVVFDAPDYFENDTPDARGDVPDAELMNYAELEAYIGKLRASGSDVVPYVVALKRKVAFPFVTIVMTLLAVPFAVTTGSRGALYGVGLGVALALLYWTALSLFGALGAGGVLDPTLAAWAPNLLFGAAALYGNLAVRT
jgi:LPS export ABC transporter permease LptF